MQDKFSISSTKHIFIFGHSGAAKGVLAQAVAKKLICKFSNLDVVECAAYIVRTPYEVLGTEST